MSKELWKSDTTFGIKNRFSFRVFLVSDTMRYGSWKDNACISPTLHADGMATRKAVLKVRNLIADSFKHSKGFWVKPKNRILTATKLNWFLSGLNLKVALKNLWIQQHSTSCWGKIELKGYSNRGHLLHIHRRFFPFLICATASANGEVATYGRPSRFTLVGVLRSAKHTCLLCRYAIIVRDGNTPLTQPT